MVVIPIRTNIEVLTNKRISIREKLIFIKREQINPLRITTLKLLGPTYMYITNSFV